MAVVAVFTIAEFRHQAFGQSIRERLRQRRAARDGGSSRPVETAAANGTTNCGAGTNVGFRILRFSSGLRAAAWYPVLEAERSFTYANGLASGVADNAPVANCKKYPVVIFSHGFGGCATQSLSFTEEVARQGYVVLAPDHKDAACKVDEPRKGMHFQRVEEPFRKPGEWSDQTYIDRRNDIRTILDQLAQLPEFEGRVEMNRVAGVGHSLGGYTMMGMAGGWQSWKDSRIKAALLFSPYAAPFLSHSRVRSINVPVMYQGGERDRGITPSIKKSGGVYDLSNNPKYFVELRNQGHLDWTVRGCGNAGSIRSCLASNPNLKTVNDYGIAFLEKYLPAGVNSRSGPSNTALNAGRGDRTDVAEYRAQQ